MGDEKDKAYQLAEGEAAALQRKFTLLQDEHQRSETKLTQTTNDLNEASNKTDEINRAIKTLETKNMIDEERIDLLENQVKEAKQMVEESDIKYDEVARNWQWLRVICKGQMKEPTRVSPRLLTLKKSLKSLV